MPLAVAVVAYILKGDPGEIADGLWCEMRAFVALPGKETSATGSVAGHAALAVPARRRSKPPRESGPQWCRCKAYCLSTPKPPDGCARALAGNISGLRQSRLVRILINPIGIAKAFAMVPSCR